MNDPDRAIGQDECREVSPRLAEWVESHGPIWLSLAHRYCGDDHHFAEDALSESIYALNRELLKGVVENPHAWMATTLRNRASERIRKESGQQRLRDELAEAMPSPDATDRGEGDEAFLIEEGHWEAIRAALSGLPPRQREVIRMRLFEKKTPEEIAEQVQCSEAAVRNAQCKAIQNLRAIIGATEDT